MKHRVIAINLPQFHPFKENDEWWGKGFTEWTNVTKARPRFKGHYQPHLPTDTGFYDLRLPEARQMQADMAKKYGIYGFCYYHYWFNGKRLMNRPIDDILSSKEPDFPFMLCWANENWTRCWDGGNDRIIMKQEYSKEDDIAHMKWLCENVFCDSRYIKIDEKPVFAIYNKETFPNIRETIKTWRDVAKKILNTDIYIIYAEHTTTLYGKDPLEYDFDASMDFQPIAVRRIQTPKYKHLKDFVNNNRILRRINRLRNYVNRLPDIWNYEELVHYHTSHPMPTIKRFPCVSPGFDNSPRRQNSTFYCFPNSTPTLYGEWLSYYIKNFMPFTPNENLIFINAWNEWAEGNHLEPDQKWGTAYLEETKKAIAKDI